MAYNSRMTLPFKSHRLKPHFANISWLLGERMIRMGLLFVVNLYLARQLGPLNFGILCYASSFVSIFFALAALGLDALVVRELVRTPQNRPQLLGTAFGLKLGGALLSGGAMAITTQVLPHDALTQQIIVVIASVMLFQAFNVIDYYFQAQVQSKFVAQALLIQLLISVGSKGALILLQADLIWFAAVYLLDGMVLAALLSLSYHYYASPMGQRWHWQTPLAQQLLKASWPLLLSALVTALYLKTDQILINFLLGPTSVGVYAVAAQLSEAWYAVPVVISASFFPAIVAAQGNPADYKAKLQTLLNGMVVIAVVIAIPLTLLSDWIIAWLYGAAYSAAAGVLKIQVWTAVFVFLGIASQHYLVAEQLTHLAFFRTVLGLATHWGLSYILIQQFGIIGAAWAALTGAMVSFYWAHALFPATRPLFQMQCQALTLNLWKARLSRL